MNNITDFHGCSNMTCCGDPKKCRPVEPENIVIDSTESSISLFIIVLALCCILAVAALYLDLNRIDLSLDYETIKLIFVQCFLFMIHLVFVDHIKTMKVFSWSISGLFVGFGSYLIWAS